MSEEKQKYFEQEELNQMFNEAFLPKIQEIAKRVQEDKYKEEDLYFFELSLRMRFKDLENPLTIEGIESENWAMKLTPVTVKEWEQYVAVQAQQQADGKEDGQGDSAAASGE